MKKNIREENYLTYQGVKGKLIEGVQIKKLNKIFDKRGAIFHMLRVDEDIFSQFGEIYFSLVYPNIVKGWHIHTKMTLNYAVVVGNIKLVLYDVREDSSTKGNLLEIFTGENNYFLIQVPPLVWNGFQGVSNYSAIVANCATLPHDPEEIKRLDPFSEKIPYNWNDENIIN